MYTQTTTISIDEVDLWSHWNDLAMRASAYVYLTVGVVVLPSCLLGNGLILIIFYLQRKSLKPYHVPLALLAVSEAVCCTYVVGLDRLVSYTLTYLYPWFHVVHLSDLSTMSCKLCSYIWLLSAFLSHHLLVLVNVERVVAVYQPFWHKVHLTKRRMALASMIFLGIAALLNIPGLVVFDLAQYGAMSSCYIAPWHSEWIVWGMQLYINLFINGLAPSCILFVLNMTLAGKLLYLRRANGANAGNDIIPIGQAMKRGPIRGVVTLLILTSLHLLMSAPKVIIFLISFLAFLSSSNSWMTFLNLGISLDIIFYINTCLSVFVYYKRYHFFRLGLNKCCCCWVICRNRSLP